MTINSNFTDGHAGVNEVQQIAFPMWNGQGGLLSILFTFPDTSSVPTGSVEWNGNDLDNFVGDLQPVVDDVLGGGQGTVVASSYAEPVGVNVEFTGQLAALPVPMMDANDWDSPSENAPVFTRITAGAAPSSATQVLTFSPRPTSGNWTFNGSNVSWNATPTVTGWTITGTAGGGTVTATKNATGSTSPLSYDAGTLKPAMPAKSTPNLQLQI